MLTKKQLKALWKEYGFRPVKRLGQNFLIDKNIRDKIIASLDLNTDETVIEIGTGFGELLPGLAARARKVFAVEKDKKIARILKATSRLPRNVTLLESDFLDLDIKALAGGKRVIIYGSIPYYITSPIIEKIFRDIACIKAIYLVVQKEVAERITAPPGSKDIGRLSLYVQYYTEPKALFGIGRNCFYPVPKVESVLLKLEVLKEKKVTVKDEGTLFRIIKAAYGKRRKTIANSLLSAGKEKADLLRLLERARVNPRERAETLRLADFARISDAFRADALN